MNTIIILSIIALAIVLSILIVRYKRKQNRKRRQHLDAILNVAKNKEEQIYSYLMANKEKFYTPESITKMDEIKTHLDDVNKELKKHR